MDLQNSTKPNFTKEVPAPIAEKLTAIMANIPTIPKNGYNKHGRFPYATADDVSKTLRPLFAEVGLAIIPEMVDYEIVTVGKSTLLFGRFKVTLAAEGTSVTYDWIGAANVNAAYDKAPFVAATGGMKYFLKNLLLIDTGDESDDTANSVTNVPTVTTGTLTELEEKIKTRNQQLESPIDMGDLIEFACKKSGREPVDSLVELQEREAEYLIKVLVKQINQDEKKDEKAE